MLYRLLEVVSCQCATNMFPVSDSLYAAALQHGICHESKMSVLGHGSSHGVDTTRFRHRDTERLLRRTELDLTEDVFVLGFVGRLSVDKGIRDLKEIWSAFREATTQGHIIVIGQTDPTDPPPSQVLTWLQHDPNVTWLGQLDAATWYSAFDVLALPSYREGFPNVVLEASASSVPTCAYRVTGSSDAVVDGVTGTLVGPGDRRAFIDALIAYSESQVLRHQHGQAAAARVRANFETNGVWVRFAEALHELLREQVTS